MKKNNPDIYDDISDDEICIIRPKKVSVDADAKSRKYLTLWKWLIVAGAVVLLAAIAAFAYYGQDKAEGPEVAEAGGSSSQTSSVVVADSTEAGYVDVLDTVVNEVALRIIIPHGGMPELRVKSLGDDSARIVFAAPAADVRSDNGEIAGAFVAKGNLISKGMPKLGFCAIVNNEITIGRQSETPLFERAIEQNGYFFRHYSLVSEGKMIAVKPKGKSNRRALCVWNGQVCIVDSRERESYHDFAQCLEDLGVVEAVALCGGNGLMMYRTNDGVLHSEGNRDCLAFDNANFLVWRLK